MSCESCGKDLPRDSAFCPECEEGRSVRSAREMVDLAHTSGLVRGRAAGGIPEVPDAPDTPDGVPELPDAAPLPDVAAGQIPTGEVAATDADLVSSVDKARVREEARRAAQALVETAQTDLREELAEIAEREARIEQREEALAATDRDARPPPPPTDEERIWQETDERTRLHGTAMPWGEAREARRDRGDDSETGEHGGFNCCVVVGVAFMLVILLLSILGLILNVAQ